MLLRRLGAKRLFRGDLLNGKNYDLENVKILEFISSSVYISWKLYLVHTEQLYVTVRPSTISKTNTVKVVIFVESTGQTDGSHGKRFDFEANWTC